MGKMTLATALTLNASGFNSGVNAAIKDTREFQQVIGGASKETIRAFKDISSMGIGEMKKNLMELKKISFAGKSKEEIQAINKRIGELTDSFGDLRAQQKGMGMEFGTLAAKGVQALGAIAEIGFGVATLFGADEEQSKKFAAAMTTVIGVMQGFGVLQDVLETKLFQSIAAKVADIAITVGQTIATTAAAAATWLLNAALGVTIGIIAGAVVVIAAIAYGLYKLITAFSDSSEEAKTNAVAIQENSKAYKELKKAGEDAFAKLQESQWNLLKSQGKISDAQLQSLKLGEEKKLALKESFEKTFTSVFELETQKRKDIEAGTFDEKSYNEAKLNLQVKSTAQRLAIEQAYQNDLATIKLDADKKDEKKPKKTSIGLGVSEGTNYDFALSAFNAEKIGEQQANRESNKIIEDEDMKFLESVASASNDATQKKVDKNTKTELEALEIQLKNAEDFNNGITDVVNGGMEDMASTIGEAFANMITDKNFGWQEFGNMILSTFGGFIQQLGQAVVTFGTLMIGFQAAVANIFNPLGAIATIGIGIALVGAGAVLKSLASGGVGYETGGIIGGTSFTGDAIPARVNSGEMILNAGQQAKLFQLANGRGNSGGGELTTRISGKDLLVVLNNENNYRRNTR